MNNKSFKNQTELFNYIWESRCRLSEVSGRQLLPKIHPQWRWQMCHILGKGSYPKYKLNIDNIMLMLPDEHEKQETFKIFRDKQRKLKLRYYNQYYNSVRQIK